MFLIFKKKWKRVTRQCPPVGEDIGGCAGRRLEHGRQRAQGLAIRVDEGGPLHSLQGVESPGRRGECGVRRHELGAGGRRISILASRAVVLQTQDIDQFTLKT